MPTGKPSPTPTERRESRLWATVKVLTRTRVIAGLITVLPIYITIFLVRYVFELMRDASQWVVYGVLHGAWVSYLPASWGITWMGVSSQELQSPRIQWGIAISSVFLTIFLLYAIGLVTANVIGHRVLNLLERFIDRLPLVKTVYRATKQILSTFASGQSPGYQRVVLVPFPTSEVRCIGFLTATGRDPQTGEELCSVFIATTPNPTSGFVFILKRRDVIELDWSVEDAVKVVMSGGLLMPGTVSFLSPAQLDAMGRTAVVTPRSSSAPPPSAKPLPVDS